MSQCPLGPENYPRFCHLITFAWPVGTAGICTPRAYLVERRSGSSEIIDRRIGALAGFQAPIPLDNSQPREQDFLLGRQRRRWAHSCQNFRVGGHDDQTGESAAVGGGFVDKSACRCRTHQDQNARQNPLGSRVKLDTLEWDAGCAREALRPQ